MHSGRDAGGNLLRGENGAKRESGGERLGDQDDVRLGRKSLITEEAAGAAEATLNFIGDQQGAVLGGDCTSAIPEFFADWIDPPFALNGFKENSANGIVEFRFKIGDVVETHEFRARNNGREGQPVFFSGGDAESAEGPAMEGMFKREEAMLVRGRSRNFFGFAAKEACELHRTVNSLGPAVGKEDAIHAGPCGEFARKGTLIGVMKKIRKVDGTRGFTADYFHDARMRVAKRVHGDTAQKIEILLSRGIENIRAAAVSQDHRLALVGGQKELFGIEQARVRFDGLRRPWFGLGNGTRQRLLF